jgi:hypothetical protein
MWNRSSSRLRVVESWVKPETSQIKTQPNTDFDEGENSEYDL